MAGGDALHLLPKQYPIDLMMVPDIITSGQNPKIKELLALQEKSRERRSAGLFVVEGQRELDHCIAAGFVPDTIFICPEIYAPAGEGVPPEGRATREFTPENSRFPPRVSERP